MYVEGVMSVFTTCLFVGPSLLDQGFEGFVRVGSVKKIAKRILPLRCVLIWVRFVILTWN